MRVKILFNKKENALVQMSDSTQAQLGNLLHMLSGLLWSSVCRETEERKKQKYHIKLTVLHVTGEEIMIMKNKILE